MKITKRVSLLIIVALLLIANTACIKDENQILLLATSADFPPYEFYQDQKIVGIDVEIAEQIALKLGKEFKVKNMAFNNILLAVAQGKADIGMAGITVSDERLEFVDFSKSYATGVQVIIVRDNSEISGPEDLKGKKIGVQEATTGDIYATRDYGEANVIKYNNGAPAIVALIQGKVDAVIIDNAPANSFVAVNEGIKILDTEYTKENYAIAVGKDNTVLLEKINQALSELISDGTVQAILDKYITE